ncbi:MAG: DNA replication/repair protein RecF [Gammaproteobacteria bacterium]|nr:MAG: DNA replication/repair protein RecF [Gammaproteobacteria bacterium]
MYISQLHVEHFRNLSSQVVPLSAKINLITGENGAGKTSLLEAIYFLGRQRSFRTAKPKELIQQDKHYFRLIAKTAEPEHQIGLERKLDGHNLSFQLRIDRQPQKSPAALVKIVPTIAITAHSFRLIDAGPAVRRAFIDYGAFHFDSDYYRHWQHYQKALKNRNAALKQKMTKSVIDSFTPFLSSYGEQLHRTRTAYFRAFKPLLAKHLRALEFPFDITIRYTPGWNSDNNLSTSLSNHYEQDYRLSHTRFGPHRADMRLTVKGGNADNRLSRGQQKALILAMHLAQMDLIGEYGISAPLLIIDDIAAEFDAEKRNHVLHYLAKLNCQMFFSTTEADFFDKEIRSLASLIQLKSGAVI